MLDYNSLLSAAVHTVLVAALYGVYRFASWLYNILLYSATITLEISSDDYQQWEWLQTFVAGQTPGKIHHWTVDMDTSTRVGYAPIAIRFPFEGKTIRLTIREVPLQNVVLQNGNGQARRVATLWTRFGDAQFFDRFLGMLKDYDRQAKKGSVAYMLPVLQNGNSYWKSLKQMRRREFITLTLGDELIDTFVQDLEHFLKPATLAFYVQHGIPYRRGYLLEGPPGNGKSSFILAAASHLTTAVYYISLSSNSLDDAGLFELMSGTHYTTKQTGQPRLLVLEDIDCLFVDRAAVGPTAAPSEPPRSRVTLSGLLNALDGLGSPENAVIMMTTNYPERLDTALVRPGRVDRRITFTSPDDTRIAAHYCKFFPKETRLSESTLEFVRECRAYEGGACSMAHVQEQVVRVYEKGGV